MFHFWVVFWVFDKTTKTLENYHVFVFVEMNKSFDFSILQRTAELGGVMDLETAEK